MRISFGEFSEFLTETLLEESNEAATAGATVTELFPCIYCYLGLQDGLGVEDMRTNGMLKFPRSVISNFDLDNKETGPFKFSKKVERTLTFLDNEVLKKFKGRDGAVLLAEKLKQANYIYQKIRETFSTVDGAYWIAGATKHTDLPKGISPEADICIDGIRDGETERRLHPISIKAQKSSAPSQTGEKAKNRSLATWLLPSVPGSQLQSKTAPLTNALNEILQKNELEPLKPSGWMLNQKTAAEIKDTYLAVRKMIVENGITETRSKLNEVRGELQKKYYEQFVKIMNSFDDHDFREILTNSMGYGDGLTIWTADNSGCYDITDTVKGSVASITNGSEFKAVISTKPGIDVTMTWKCDGRVYDLDVQIRMMDSLAKARREKGQKTSKSQLNKTLDMLVLQADLNNKPLPWDNKIKPDVTSASKDKNVGTPLLTDEERKRLKEAYDSGFFGETLFAILFKSVDVWKVMTILPKHGYTGTFHHEEPVGQTRSWLDAMLESRQNVNNRKFEMRTLKENQKITLTIGQLKRLVRESRTESFHINTFDKSAIVYHSTESGEELNDILLKGEFRTGKNGTMLLPGFYANFLLSHAQKHHYGPNILKAKVVNLDNFFFVNYNAFQKCFGNDSLTWQGQPVDEDNFIDYQKAKLGWDGTTSGRYSNFTQAGYDKNGRGEYSRSWIVPILNNETGYGFRSHFRRVSVAGIVYHGGYDGDAIVCWDTRQIIPLEVSYDNGDTWSEATKITKSNVANYVSVFDGDEVSGSSEYAISCKRAYDIIDRAGGLSNTDDILDMALQQLGAIRDPGKFEARKAAFLEVFAKNEDVVDAIRDKKVKQRRWY